MNATIEAGREQAFQKIMGLDSMPADDSPDYDRWLFDRAFSAGVQEGMEQAAKECDSFLEEIPADRWPPDGLASEVRRLVRNISRAIRALGKDAGKDHGGDKS